MTRFSPGSLAVSSVRSSALLLSLASALGMVPWRLTAAEAPHAQAASSAADVAAREFADISHSLPAITVNTIENDSFGLKELGLSSQQQERLRTIFDEYGKELSDLDDEETKQLEGLPPLKKGVKQAAVEAEFQAARMEKTKAVATKAKSVLTPEQLTKLKNIVVRNSVRVLLAPQMREKLSLTAEQAKQLTQLYDQWEAKIASADESRALPKLTERALAVLTPQQREKLAAYVDTQPVLVQTVVSSLPAPDCTMAFAATSGSDAPPAMVGQPHNLSKALKLTAEQETQLTAISGSYGISQEKLNVSVRHTENLSPAERKKKWAEHDRQRQALNEDIRAQIDRVLTPQQLETLKKIVLDDVAVGALTSPWMLKHTGATAEQQQKLRRLGGKKEEAESQDLKSFLETTKKYEERSLAVLSPQQREKFEDELERLAR